MANHVGETLLCQVQNPSIIFPPQMTCIISRILLFIICVSSLGIRILNHEPQYPMKYP